MLWLSQQLKVVLVFIYEQVDEHTGLTPKKRTMAVPSIESIEETRTHITEDENFSNNNSENRSKWMDAAETKIPRLTTASPNRTPFANVN